CVRDSYGSGLDVW
nr:immunoglobulin heavy chain junction region [Macaca mulatta]MOV92081.1 immunoglobulin heavy chain junction region [Macaca mulatta]MOY18114.1 immunoglobulin heavy chain junction region [Macaca mulatta]MOY19276.1 immunoglobulin heavy chain junction region [Macaca mulatta]MOY19767.1 immunoglobulin heavy chain junction region [Macaca mulatta]